MIKFMQYLAENRNEFGYIGRTLEDIFPDGIEHYFTGRSKPHRRILDAQVQYKIPVGEEKRQRIRKEVIARRGNESEVPFYEPVSTYVPLDNLTQDEIEKFKIAQAKLS